MNTDAIAPLLLALATDNTNLEALGRKVGKLYTDHGLPLDMALARLKGLSPNQKLAVVSAACTWLIEHKRLSGATEKALDRQRKTNREMVDRFVKTGEVGIY